MRVCVYVHTYMRIGAQGAGVTGPGSARKAAVDVAAGCWRQAVAAGGDGSSGRRGGAPHKPGVYTLSLAHTHNTHTLSLARSHKHARARARTHTRTNGRAIGAP